MKHLEKIDLEKISSGDQEIFELSENMINEWKKFKNEITDEKFKKSIDKKIKGLKDTLDQARAGMPFVEIKLVGEYGALWTVFQSIDDQADYAREFSNSITSEKILLFVKYKETFTDEEYWANLGSNYQLQDYAKIPYTTYYKLFLSKRKHREKLMNPEELEFFSKLPDKFTIYRGGTESEAKNKIYGVSWTLNKAIAEKFQNVKKMRDRKPMVVHELEIDKSEAIAYLNERQEEEIIYIHPKHYVKYRAD